MWDERERLSDATKIERLEERVGILEDRLALAQDGLEFALTFYRAVFTDQPTHTSQEWFDELEVKLSHALAQARRK